MRDPLEVVQTKSKTMQPIPCKALKTNTSIRPYGHATKHRKNPSYQKIATIGGPQEY